MTLRFFIAFPLLLVFLTACGIGGIWLEPSNRPRSVEYPYGARWVKEGMTRESRLADWVACGGGSDLRDGFRTNRYQEPMREYLQELEHHRLNVWSCMNSKQYLYFNKGYEYEYPKVEGNSQKCDVRCLYP
jgi:hypothetical protein